MAMEMPPAIKAYSIAVAADRSAKKPWTNCRKAHLLVFSKWDSSEIPLMMLINGTQQF